MKSRKIKIELLAPAAVLTLALGVGGMLVRPAGEPDQVLKNRFGDVLWNHELHARMPGLKCATCHHKEDITRDSKEGATIPKPCKECHPRPTSENALILAGLFGGETATPAAGEGKGPLAMTAYHGKCAGCHLAMKKGPLGCRDCHNQKFSGPHGQVVWNHLEHSRRMGNLQCSSCHHPTETYQPEKESDYKGCGECHQRLISRPRPLEPLLAEHENAVHGQCSYCHTTSNPEENTVSCSRCHPDLAVQKGQEQPVSAEEAVHQKCLACHRKDNPDWEEGMPAICTDCHRPSPSVLAGWTTGYALWSHTRHLPEFNAGVWQCETCHHTDLEGFPHLACSSCHGRGNYLLSEKEMPSLAKAYEKTCIKCHKEKKSGPVRLADFTAAEVPGVMASTVGTETVIWDHRFHADTLAFSCRECHHNARTKDGALIICPSAVSCPEEEGIGAIQSCRRCHGELGPVPASPAEVVDLEAPPLAEAFRRPCLACHQKLGAGPQNWEEMGSK